MDNTLGKLFCVQLIGESHGHGVGATVQGCPAGLLLEEGDIQGELDKRRPGQALTTQRQEKDRARILAGTFNQRTTGAPILLWIENKDVDSSYYEETKDTPRPGHADYAASQKYGGFNDYRGGGPLSGRLTAAMVCAGAIAKKLLALHGVKVLAHVKQLGCIEAGAVSDEDVLKNVYKNPVRCANQKAVGKMIAALEEARAEGDSLGAVVECRVLGLPVGLGEPLADSVEGLLSRGMFAIPAVKGVEFGSGFKAAEMKGSEHNDAYVVEGSEIRTKTNNAGGILGGMTNGMPVVFRVAFKPTSSIQKTQQTVSVRQKTASELKVRGRHDPCVAIRAVPVVESMTACVFADLMLRAQKIRRVLE